MLMKRRSIIICLGLLVGLLGANNTYAQCDIIVDTANITQVTCPGGSDGFANLTQTPYINYSWDNINKWAKLWQWPYNNISKHFGCRIVCGCWYPATFWFLPSYYGFRYFRNFRTNCC